MDALTTSKPDPSTGSNATGFYFITTEIDLKTGRDAAHALGDITTDFRARLFQERLPEAYAILTPPSPHSQQTQTSLGWREKTLRKRNLTIHRLIR
jgi:hypothetical protein